MAAGIRTPTPGIPIVQYSERGDQQGSIRVEGPQSAKIGNHKSFDDDPDPTYIRFNVPRKPGDYTITIGGRPVDGFTVSPEQTEHSDATRGSLATGWNGNIRLVDWPKPDTPVQTQTADSKTIQPDYDPDNVSTATQNKLGIQKDSNSKMVLGPDESVSSGTGPSITNLGDSDGNSMSDGGISLGLVAAVIAVVVVLRGMM